MKLTPAGDIMLLHMGGLGDLVLLAEPAAALRLARPEGRLVLICREQVAGATSLWPNPPDEIIALNFVPELWAAPSEALEQAILPVMRQLAGRRAALLIDAGVRPGWFGEFLAALLAPDAALCCPGAPEPPGNALCHVLLAHFGLAAREMRRLTVPPRLHERERHRHWLAACGGGPVGPLPQPSPWALPPALRSAARDWLANAGLPETRYLVCCPCGAPSTRLKRWPEANFAAVLRHAGLPVLLLGSTEERESLLRVAAALEGLPLVVLAASPRELPLAAGLLALAKGWLTNDSGPMHLGQAYGVPGVAVFGGGGRWPSYTPWAPGALGVACPLPCFGCDWDCLLGHALCVESVGVAAVQGALDRCLANPRTPPEVIPLAGPNQPVRQLLADASASYQAVQRDRAARLEGLLLTTLQARQSAARLEESERQRAMFEHAAVERLDALERLNVEAEARLDRIAALESERAADAARITDAFQICIGLGAGNIGDELMANAFWRQLPDGLRLEVPLFPEAARHRAAYPPRHRYTSVDWQGNENAAADMPGLLVGATPVTEAEGMHWPLQFLAPRLRHFHARGLPVDAVGVGIEPLRSDAARALFAEAFAPIRSWTVRSPACRETLLELGVAPSAVKIGADWAWLHTPRRDARGWAGDWWRQHGIDPERKLLVVNVVNMQWRDHQAVRAAIASALDAAVSRHGLQLAFLCNECRDGDFFDYEAARALAALLRHPAVLLPNLYYAPDEVIALLAHATVTLGQRYHFLVESVLAGTLPISIPRGAKMQGLAAELGLAAVGSVEGLDARALEQAIDAALADRPARLLHLAERQRDLRLRAAGNLDLIRRLPPYAALWPPLD